MTTDHESESFVLLRINIALLTECGALFFRGYKHCTPPG
jgi:hypothetical protein